MEDTLNQPLKTLHLRTLHAPRLGLKVVGDFRQNSNEAIVFKFCWALNQEKLNIHMASEYLALNFLLCVSLIFTNMSKVLAFSVLSSTMWSSCSVL